ncbi:MAG: NAD(P)H-dependent glycerol-3-phosphate dehydrogenase, partial [bacterium]|nr:NAD(P)H-dependent glycerol-3-phosphate dehydrogenase [bacterium]
MAKIVVLGSGGWGTALAINAFNNKHEVCMWSPFEQEVDTLNREREHKKLLPGIKIPEGIDITFDFSKLFPADVTVIATPSTAVRSTAAKLRTVNSGIIVNVAKGLEISSQLRLSQVISQEVGDDRRVVVLSGPSHAEEVARNMPTSVVVASNDLRAAQFIQQLMSNKTFRIYTNNDVIGVELGGALKNIIAVAAGIVDGLGLGDNTKAALVTRGIAEISRFGKAMGAKENTFNGLAGIGDLIVTCMSRHSRNHNFGEKLGMGVEAEEAKRLVGTVEGYYACEAVHKIALEKGIDMPICEECYNTIFMGVEPEKALNNLMSRPCTAEDSGT